MAGGEPTRSTRRAEPSASLLRTHQVDVLTKGRSSPHPRTRRRGPQNAEGGTRIRVLLADNHPATRLGVRVLLEDVRGAEVVGEAGDADEVLSTGERLAPDLVILDPEMGPGGEDVCRDLKSLPRPPRVLIYSARNTREAVAAASLAGADSYVHKEADADRLGEAVWRTCGGERIWVLGTLEAASETGMRARIEAARLTPKEKEILDRLLRRMTNQEIAAELHVSVNTVRTHVKNVLREVGIENRRALLEPPAA